MNISKIIPSTLFLASLICLDAYSVPSYFVKKEHSKTPSTKVAPANRAAAQPAPATQGKAAAKGKTVAEPADAVPEEESKTKNIPKLGPSVEGSNP